MNVHSHFISNKPITVTTISCGVGNFVGCASCLGQKFSENNDHDKANEGQNSQSGDAYLFSSFSWVKCCGGYVNCLFSGSPLGGSVERVSIVHVSGLVNLNSSGD